MAGEAGLHGDLGGLAVADFADHDDVRVLAENGRRPAAKVRPTLLFTCVWPTPSIAYSTGVFHCEDIAAAVVELAQAGIERGRLAAAGRAR